MPGVWGGPERALDLLELELKTEQQVLLAAELSPTLSHIFLSRVDAQWLDILKCVFRRDN